MSHIWATFVLCIVFSGIISAGGGGGNAGGCDHLKEQLKTLLGNAGSCKKQAAEKILDKLVGKSFKGTEHVDWCHL
uniref:Saposin B-type domain-containing protein n=1 Tax=Trichobilharzia regenti TaxID=157069 RepID=A0AA85IXF3_TRIRE|nr:unnamed protein product [Trichobilharzia regenti]